MLNNCLSNTYTNQRPSPNTRGSIYNPISISPRIYISFAIKTTTYRSVLLSYQSPRYEVLKSPNSLIFYNSQ